MMAGLIWCEADPAPARDESISSLASRCLVLQLQGGEAEGANEEKEEKRPRVTTQVLVPFVPEGAETGAESASIGDLVAALDRARDAVCKTGADVAGPYAGFFTPIMWHEKSRAGLLLAALRVWVASTRTHLWVPTTARITLVTGPVGSGKSTVIQATLQALHMVTARAPTRVLGGYFERPPVVFVRDMSRMYDRAPSLVEEEGMTPVIVPPALLVAEVLRAHGVKGVGGIASTSVGAGVPGCLCWSSAAFETGALTTQPHFASWLNRSRIMPVVAVDEFPAVYAQGGNFGKKWHKQMTSYSFGSGEYPCWFVLSGSSVTSLTLLRGRAKVQGTDAWVANREALHAQRLETRHIGPVKSREDLMWMLKHVMWPNEAPSAVRGLSEDAEDLAVTVRRHEAWPQARADEDADDVMTLPLVDVLLATSGLPRILKIFAEGLSAADTSDLPSGGAALPPEFRDADSAVPVALALACESAMQGADCLSSHLEAPFSVDLSKFMVPWDVFSETLGRVLAFSAEHGLQLQVRRGVLHDNLLIWAEKGVLAVELEGGPGSEAQVKTVGFGNMGTVVASFARYGLLVELHPEVVRQMTTPGGTEATEYGEPIFLASLCDTTKIGEGDEAVEWNHLGLLLKEHGKVCPSLGDRPIIKGGPTAAELIERIGTQPLRWTARDEDQVAALRDPRGKRAVLLRGTKPEPGVLYATKSDSGVDVVGWLLVRWTDKVWVLVQVLLQVKQTGRGVMLSPTEALNATLRIARVRFTTGLGTEEGSIVGVIDGVVRRLPVTGIVTNRETSVDTRKSLLEQAVASTSVRSGKFWLPKSTVAWGEAPPQFPDLDKWGEFGGTAKRTPRTPATGTYTVDLVPVARTGDVKSGALVPHGGIGLLATPAEMKKYWCAPVRMLAHELGLDSYGGKMTGTEVAKMQARASRVALDALALLTKTYKTREERERESQQQGAAIQEANRLLDVEAEKRKLEDKKMESAALKAIAAAGLDPGAIVRSLDGVTLAGLLKAPEAVRKLITSSWSQAKTLLLETARATFLAETAE